MSDGDSKSEPKASTSSTGSSTGGTTEPPPPTQRIQWQNIIGVMKEKQIDTGLWATRLITIVFSMLYLLPIFGPGVSFYYRAFIANAATSALRLHQRLPPLTFSREFFMQLISEDSCHYLFYSLIFIYCTPITLAILPVLLFAVLHFASFSLTLLDSVGRNSAWIGRIFISLIEFQAQTILKLAAAAEIFTMVFVVAYLFAGRASLMMPFLYYRFLTLRYASRRNHYTRLMFYELRLTAERLANSPKCPAVVGGIVRKAIGYISQLAPAVVVQQ